MSDTRSTAFRKDIQGLRAIAVLSVVAFHTSLGRYIPGGFTGVDVFFVISGFLITSILMKETARGSFSLLGFYDRRIRRIIPALTAMLAFTLLAGLVLLPPDALQDLSRSAVAAVLFASNINFVLTADYFGPDAELAPLLHTWSLAVEEQFYVLFPLIIFALRNAPRRVLEVVLLIGLAASLAISVVFSSRYPTAAFYLAPTRAFELLIGAFLAVRPRMMAEWKPSWRDIASLVGLAMIGLSFFVITTHTAFPGYAALAPCLGAALVIGAGVNGESLGGRIISSPAFVGVGNLSYSLYLWHWPLLVFARHLSLGAPSPWMEGGAVLLSFAAAYASWRWIERPFVRAMPSLNAVPIGLGVMAACVAAAIIPYLLDGLPQRFDARSLSYFAAAEDVNPRRERCHGSGRQIPYEANCVFGAAGSSPEIAVWGDSHGAELSVALGSRLASQGRGVMEITTSACPPSIGFASPETKDCQAHNRQTLDRLVTDPRIREVVLTANFAIYPRADWPTLIGGYQQAVRELRRANKKVVLIEPMAIFHYDPPSAIGLLRAWKENPAAWGLSMAEYQRRNRPFIDMIARLDAESGVSSVKTAAALCRPQLCPALGPTGEVLYFNDRHISLAGARILARAVPVA